MEVFENLAPEVSGYQRAKRSGRLVSQEVKVADLLGDDAQPRAVTESASATTLVVPGKYLSWLVYSEIKARWRCWRPEVGGETLCRAKISGL